VEAFWAGTSFLLASTVFQPNFVNFSHAFGRKPLLIVALIFFTSGAVMCGASTSFPLMLSGRAIQGLGCGGINALTETLVTDLVPLRERGKYFSIISAVWAVGSVSGPVVGGALAQNEAWRWLFWINVPIAGVGFVGIIMFLNLEKRNGSLREKMAEIDYIGSLIFIVALTSFLIPITWGGVLYSWGSWQTLAPMIIGAFGLVGFCLYEGMLAKHTLLPMRLFYDRSTSICYFADVIHGIILWTILYFLPLYFEGVKGYSFVIAGVAALPQTVTVIPCAAIAGVIAAYTGHYRWALWAGWVLTVFGCGLMCLLGVETTVVQWIFINAVSGIGVGLLFPSMQLAIQASAPQEDIAVAAALFTFFRGCGETIGVAIGGVIFQNRIAIELQKFPDLPASQYSLDAVAIVKTISSLPADLPQVLHIKAAFGSALQVVWAVMCGLAGIALIASCFVKRYGLDQALQTEQGFRSKPLGGQEISESDLENLSGCEAVPESSSYEKGDEEESPIWGG
jgi:EmrB/QacA subfamily drug resistance transporter